MKKLYTVNEVAETLHVSPKTVRYWVQHGKIKYFRVGSLVRFEEEQVKDFLEEKRPTRKPAIKSLDDDPHKTLYTRSEAASYLGCSYADVYSMEKRGKLFVSGENDKGWKCYSKRQLDAIRKKTTKPVDTGCHLNGPTKVF